MGSITAAREIVQVRKLCAVGADRENRAIAEAAAL